eukprot:CAMPEP_0170479418 /NCGR_PEP_ID=MMETSP0208-20121228/666_1 /TAXON_ID=197538 /ORGANISM="Strombidium inclinatum, Strain S3" /LENGTH=156 /DNA_ID=CAMNT_0010751809 /DNA_START=449 /DNA_END=921 /DNA_ORIENTATION=-
MTGHFQKKILELAVDEATQGAPEVAGNVYDRVLLLQRLLLGFRPKHLWAPSGNGSSDGTADIGSNLPLCEVLQRRPSPCATGHATSIRAAILSLFNFAIDIYSFEALDKPLPPSYLLESELAYNFVTQFLIMNSVMSSKALDNSKDIQVLLGVTVI